MPKYSIPIGDIQGDQPARTESDAISRLAGLVREMDIQVARVRNEQIGVNADLVICKRELAATRKALESLTPGGSCGEDEIDRLTAENAALREGAKRGEAAIAEIHSKYQSQFAALASLRTKVNALLSEIDESQDRLLINHRLSESLPALREEVAK